LAHTGVRPLPRAEAPGDEPLARARAAGQHLAPGADRPAPEDHPQPAPRQVVRGGPRAPRVRPALLPAGPRARPEQRGGPPPDGELLQEDRRLAAAGPD